MLESMRTFVETASDIPWRPSDGFLAIVYRTALHRQFDSLEAIAHLVITPQRIGAFGQVPIITAEELAWPDGLHLP